MTSAYTFLPTKVVHRPRVSCSRKRLACQYMFAFLLFLTIIIMSLYEFYFSVVQRVENGSMKNSVLEAIICEVFMLSICPKKNAALRSRIEALNKAQFIQNSEGHRLTDQSIVIVVQVHTRVEYLEQLIRSLHSVKDISSTLLIFSHDYYSEEINELVQKIEFVPVMQMYFPLSIQLYPNEFPGTSPKDCLWNMPVNEAKSAGCEGASTPDAYGHYRQGSITQIKHHWWWKINRVFDNLSATKHFSGYVMFLEEDHYLAPDALHVLRLMIDLSPSVCPECNSLHIGNYKTLDNFQETSDKIDVAEWSNMGFAFNRTMWKMLKSCSNVFCTFDDYNWDWSYLFTAQKCFFKKLSPLVIHSSRVFHIGDCGTHHKEKNCQVNKSLKKVNETLEAMTPFLFPDNLRLWNKNFHQTNVKKGWGGWADPRDIELCLNITSWSTSR